MLLVVVCSIVAVAAVDTSAYGHRLQLAVDNVVALLDTARKPHPPWTMQWEEMSGPHVLICSLVLFVFGILCSAAGIGGGGVYVAALVAAGNLPLHDAVPLSKAVVFFGAVASLLVNMRKMNSPNGSVIDLDTCKLMVPASLIGTFLGVLLNTESKDITILATLSLLLIVMTGAVFRTAWRQRQEELVLERLSLGTAGLTLSGLPAPYEVGQARETPVQAAEVKGSNAPSLEDVFVVVWTLLVVMLSGVLHFHIKRCHQDNQAGSSFEPESSCNHPIVMTLFHGRFKVWMQDPSSALFLQALALSVPTFSCCAVAGYYALEVRQRAHWPVSRLLGYQAVAVMTGVLAGLVGVGGGLIFSPFFLLMGMDPAIAVGTSSTCVLFTSSSTTVQYLFTDRIIMSLALVYGIVALAASSSGTTLVHYLRTHFPLRKSYITLIVASSIAVSVVLVLVKAMAVVRAAMHEHGGDQYAIER